MLSDQANAPIEAAFAAFVSAMEAGDTSRLRRLISDTFTLTHITGYVQPGTEWLAEIERDDFIYHRITITDLHVTTEKNKGKLTALSRTDARVYGSRNEWRLQLTIDYVWREMTWIAERAVATLWT